MCLYLVLSPLLPHSSLNSFLSSTLTPHLPSSLHPSLPLPSPFLTPPLPSFPPSLPSLLPSSRWMSEDQLNLLKPSLLDHLPNTYTYTKGLAEYVLLKEAADLPTAIMRPAIIGASLREPAPVQACVTMWGVDWCKCVCVSLSLCVCVTMLDVGWRECVCVCVSSPNLLPPSFLLRVGLTAYKDLLD